MNDSTLSSQVFISMLASMLQEWAKNNKAPILAWLSHCSPVANRIVSAVLAALIAAGFTASYDSHGGTLVIGGLTIQGVLLFGWMFIRSLLTQHFTFKLIQTATALKPVYHARCESAKIDPPTPLL